MDSLEVNKVIAAILVGGIAFMVAGFIGEAMISPTELKQPVLKIAMQTEGATAAAKPAPVPPIIPLLAKADVKKGQEFVDTVCAACHNDTAGAGAKIGPNLYDVVDRPRASVKGFDYSSGLKALGGKWTYHNLDLWLYDPQAVVADTRMTYTGIKQTQTRADVIAFLRTLSPHPAALPSAEEVKAAEAEAAPPAAPAKQAAAAAAPGAAPAAAAKPGIPSIDTLLASADVKQGQATFQQVCSICHNDAKGAGAKIGPDLYDVVGRKRYHVKGFDYSDAVKKLGGTWTYDNLNQWLYDPAAVAPGTRMAFPGLKNTKTRADVIAYLRSLAEHPEPLPAANAGQPAAAAPTAPGNVKP